MAGHIHAELMAQYAEDAQKTEKPWELWEYRFRGAKAWKEAIPCISWNARYEYRRKPDPITMPQQFGQQWPDMVMHDEPLFMPVEALVVDPVMERIGSVKLANSPLHTKLISLGRVHKTHASAEEWLRCYKKHNRVVYVEEIPIN